MLLRPVALNWAAGSGCRWAAGGSLQQQSGISALTGCVRAWLVPDEALVVFCQTSNRAEDAGSSLSEQKAESCSVHLSEGKAEKQTPNRNSR